MLGDSGLPPLDLPALLQFGITALALVCGLLFVVRNAASRYFVVDAGFEADGYEGRRAMSVGDEKCFVCGRPGTKKCSRCKSVRYCSQDCQAKHWKDGHKHKCKEPKLVNDSIIGRTSGRRKTSGFGSSIALVPARVSCKVLEQPKKILFPYDDFVKLFNWDKQNFPPCGLLNCGNSCFANVVLQCLACTRPLVAYLLEGSHLKICSRNDWCFLCELQIHIQKVSQSTKPFSPTNILSRLPKIGGNLGHGRQEDAHEFMRFAIDTMQSVCLDEFGGEKSLETSIQETTLIQHIFGGHLQSQVKCTKCDKISNRYENMMDLTVEIQGDAESLEECLNQFTGKEWLDGENMYKCDGCDEYVKAWKRLTVHQPPNILTIALKRFQGGRFGKLNKRVSFPDTLDLGPYMSGTGTADGTDVYTLYAVVVHIDMLNASFFGHYICYTKDFCGNWYRIDDCKVMKVDIEEVLAQGAYMLLYSRRTVRRPPVMHLDTSASSDEKSTETDPVSVDNHMLTKSMENLSESQSEEESCQKEAEVLDLPMHVHVGIDPVVQELGDGGLNVLQSMDLDKLQEIDFDQSQKMDVDKSPESNSCEAVDDDLNSGSSVPENLDSGLSEQNALSLKEFEGKRNLQTSVDYCFMKENDPIKTSDELFNDVAETSISMFIPALHEMPEPIESNPSGPRSGHVIKVDGSSDLAVGVNGLHNSLFSSGGQEDLGSLCIDSTSTEELLQPSSSSFVENSMVKEDMNIENGVGHLCGWNIRNQLECECKNLNSIENLKPLLYPGFLDSRTQNKSPNENKQMKSNEVDHLGNNFAGTMEMSQLNTTTDTLPYSDNCNGLLHESERLSSKGSPEPFSPPGFLNGHVQEAPPNGKAETESGAVGIPCKIRTENGQLDFHCNDNGNSNGLLCESDKPSARGHSKPLFSRGFLGQHAEKRSLKGKTERQSGGTLPCKDNINHLVSCSPQPIQQNGDNYDASQKSLRADRKQILLDSPNVPLISRGFLNKTYEKSQKDVETARNNQNGYSVPGKANCNGS